RHALLRSRFARTSRTRSISASRPTTGSSSPRDASSVRLRPSCERSGYCFGSSAKRAARFESTGRRFAFSGSRFFFVSLGMLFFVVSLGTNVAGTFFVGGAGFGFGASERARGAIGTMPLGRAGPGIGEMEAVATRDFGGGDVLTEDTDGGGNGRR